MFGDRMRDRERGVSLRTGVVSVGSLNVAHCNKRESVNENQNKQQKEKQKGKREQSELREDHIRKCAPAEFAELIGLSSSGFRNLSIKTHKAS